MRTIAAAMLASIRSASAELVQLIEFSEIVAGSESAVLNITTGASTLSWDGKTWDGLGGAIELDALVETADERAAGVDFALPAVNVASVVSVLKNAQSRAGILRVWIAHIDRSTGQVVADPLGPWKYFTLGGFDVSEEPPEGDRPGFAVLSGRAASRVAELQRERGLRTNDESLRDLLVAEGVALGSADTFFQNVPQIMDKEISRDR